MTAQRRSASGALNDRERALIDFERSWWREHAAIGKGTAITAVLGISPSRYYALLSELAERPAAFSYDPLVITRVRSRRAERRRAAFFGMAPEHRHRP